MIHAIACIDKSGGIGYRNNVLFHIDGDMQLFKRLTTNNVVLMGRATYESIGHALSNRLNIVISRKLSTLTDAAVYSDIKAAMQYAQAYAKYTGCEIYVIGGQSIYEQCLSYCDQLDLTIVNERSIQVDAYFPSLAGWKEVSRELLCSYKRTTVVYTKWHKCKHKPHKLCSNT